MLFFRLIIFCLVTALIMYYSTLVLQVANIVRVKEDTPFKFNWKYLIPFYQYYKILK